MTWKHVAVLISSLVAMVLCSRLGCAEHAGDIAKLIAAGVIGNAMTTPAERKKKKVAVAPK